MLSENEILNNIQRVTKLIDKITDDSRKNKIKELFEKIGDKYFTAPASSQEKFHDAYPGGLAKHSLQVTKNLNELSKLWYSSLSIDSIIICGLLHDVGKATTVNGLDIYIKETEDWKIRRGNLYYHNLDIRDGLTHAQRSIRLIAYYDISLTDEEYIAILSHDGLYVDENQVFKNKFGKLGLLLQWSDLKTTHWDNL